MPGVFPMIDSGIIFMPHPAQQPYYGQSIRSLKDQYIYFTEIGRMYVPPSFLYVDLISEPVTFTLILKTTRIFKHVDHTAKYLFSDSLLNMQPALTVSQSNDIDVLSKYFDYTQFCQVSNSPTFAGNAASTESNNYSSESGCDVKKIKPKTAPLSNQKFGELFDSVIKPETPAYEIKNDLKKIWANEKSDKRKESDDNNRADSSYASVVKKRSGNSTDSNN